ncbi:MAG: sulfite exporter TauE/SafE family protein [Methylotenera sp.]
MEYLLYLATGLFTGLLSGLLGVGGGLIMVPVLSFIFATLGFSPAYIMHMALGTSLAVIIATSIASSRAHHQHHNVDWDIVKKVALGIMLGAFLGGLVAARFDTSLLKVLFVIYTFLVAFQILSNYVPNPARILPARPALNLVGFCIGWVSSFVGIGGGTLSVPFLIYCNVHTKRAIGTSSAIGLPIALAGAIGYIVSGLNFSNLPGKSLGFVYLPAFTIIALASLISAPFGAILVQKLSVKKLKKIFAILLIAIGCKMLFSLL